MTISFIIIGRNEGFKLPLAIRGVTDFIKQHQLTGSEVIYVDSASTDDSVSRVRALGQGIRVVELMGRTNAAIARNAGAGVAQGSVLFFVDGDMELQPAFPLALALEEARENVLFSGQILNVVYDETFGKELRRELYYPPQSAPRKEWYFGGLFVIDAELWRRNGGMRASFVYGEDLDLSMRLSEQGHRLTRYPEVLALHRTTDKRLGLRGLLKNACYSRGYLYRKHIFHGLVVRRILRSDPTVIVLLMATLAAILTGSMIALMLYLAIAMGAALYFSAGSAANRLARMVQQPLRDLFVLGSFLFYFPSEPGIQAGTVVSTGRSGSTVKQEGG